MYKLECYGYDIEQIILKFSSRPIWLGCDMEHDPIQFRAEFTIEVGKIEEYKRLVHEMSRAIEASEPDTLSYLVQDE
jgi:hypothetical protein